MGDSVSSVGVSKPLCGDSAADAVVFDILCGGAAGRFGELIEK